MAFKEDLESEVKQILREQWIVEDARSIPDPDQLRLSNHAKNIESAVVMYADLDGSTNMVNSFPWTFSAEVYKTYLRCAARIISAENGTITAYDGDRIMAIFTGDSKNTSAVRSAMKINHAVIKIIQPAIEQQYPEKTFALKHVIGIDNSQLRASRIGVRGYNDLVWIGRAANYAAKLTAFSGKALWITKPVYDAMHDSVRHSNGTNMWEQRFWTPMNNMEIYGSNWWYAV